MSALPTDAAAGDVREQTRAFLRAVEQGATGAALASFYAPTARLVEYPNLLNPRGVSRDLAAILQSAERGQQVVRDQRYEIHALLADGERVAVRVTWSAELKVPLGARQTGDRLEAEFAVFLTFHAGKIVEHHSYDCFVKL